jgi:hypothetical protein
MEKILIESVIVYLGMIENISSWSLEEMVTLEFDNSAHSCDLSLIEEREVIDREDPSEVEGAIHDINEECVKLRRRRSLIQ